MKKKLEAVKARSEEPDARMRIVAAATNRFAATGFEGTSTRQIAEEAGVAQSLLLYHFASKEALWKEVMDTIFNRARTIIGGAVAETANRPAGEQVSALIHALIVVFDLTPGLHRLMTLEGYAQSERLSWLVERHLRPFYVSLLPVVKQAQREGALREGDPTLIYHAAIVLTGSLFNLAPQIKLLDPRSDSADPAVVEAIVRALLLDP